MKKSQLRKLIREVISQEFSPNKLKPKFIKEQMSQDLMQQMKKIGGEGNLLPRRFMPCQVSLDPDAGELNADTGWLVCDDDGQPFCNYGNPESFFTPGNAAQSQLERQNEFYEAVGSPSPGDIIRFDLQMNYFLDDIQYNLNLDNIPQGDMCLRYLGTEVPDNNSFMGGSLYAANSLNPQNMGNVDCMECVYTMYSCSPNSCAGCVEDSQGPFTSLEECEASGCSQSVESFAISLGINPGASGMTAAEQYCIKCSTNSWPSPMDQKCKCCGAEQYIDGPVKPNVDGMPTLPQGDIAPTQKDRMQKLANIKPGNEKI